jgi:uncharacterized protein (DUF427 family)
MRPRTIEPRPGQESVWDYPRPPRLERVAALISIRFAGEVLAESQGALRILETSHPPTYYLPPADIAPGALQPAGGGSFCEWKGAALYFDVGLGGRKAVKAAWSYPAPLPDYAELAGFVAFYAAPMDLCMVGAHRVTPQPGGFYGGWVTPDIVGPFKGEPGTSGW